MSLLEMKEKEHFITHFMSIVLETKNWQKQYKKTKNPYPISFMNMDLLDWPTKYQQIKSQTT